MPEPVDPTAQPAPRLSPRKGVVATEAAPTIAGGTRAETSAATPEPAYILYAHPDRWTVIEGRVVPQCAKLVLATGANGIETTTKGEVTASSLELALGQIKVKGGQPIPLDVDGPGRSYLKRTANGGWISRWEKLYPNSAERTVDSKGYAEWLVGLVERGVLEAPPLYALEGLRNDLVKRLERLLQRPNVGPNSRSVERTQRDLDAVEREIAARYAHTEPEEGEEATPFGVEA